MVVEYNQMPKKNIDQKAKKLLIQTLVRLCSEKDVFMFLDNLFSSSEVKDFSRRLFASKLLIKGKTYEEVEEIMGMGMGTINKVRFKTKGSPLLNRLFNKKD